MPKPKLSPESKLKPPFEVGDIVRPNADYPFESCKIPLDRGKLYQITKLWKIYRGKEPHSHVGGFWDAPWRVHLEGLQNGEPTRPKNETVIWVGFLEHDAFMNGCKRAIDGRTTTV